jgi:hypothetical protein
MKTKWFIIAGTLAAFMVLALALTGCGSGGGGQITIDFASPGNNQISFTLSKGEWSSAVTYMDDVLLLAFCTISNGTGDFASISISTLQTKTILSSVRSNGNKTFTVTFAQLGANAGSFDMKLGEIDTVFASHIIGYTNLSLEEVGGTSGANLAAGSNDPVTISIP